MKKILFYFGLGLLIQCTSTPKRDFRFIEIPEVVNVDQNKVLTLEELKFDISQALYALNTAYSGKKFLPPGEFQKLVEPIGEIDKPSSVAELCEKIGRLMFVVSDSHLDAKFNNTPCFKRPNSQVGTVGKNVYSDKNGIPWKVKIIKKNNSAALLISITEFPQSTNPVWNGFIDEVKTNLSKSHLVVIDMRGNGGGDDTKGFELSALLAGGAIKSPYKKQWSNPSPEAKQLFVNSVEYSSRLKKAEGKEIPPYLVELKKKFLEARNKSLKGPDFKDANDADDNESDFDLEKSIKKPIYILIDAECGSSCESSTDFFENNPLVKTVGENTAGYVHFGNNGNVFLKNSGINLKMATSFNSYVDGRFIEKTGIKPKIQVPSGKDALDYVWKDFLSTN